MYLCCHGSELEYSVRVRLSEVVQRILSAVVSPRQDHQYIFSNNFRVQQHSHPRRSQDGLVDLRSPGHEIVSSRRDIRNFGRFRVSHLYVHELGIAFLCSALPAAHPPRSNPLHCSIAKSEFDIAVDTSRFRVSPPPRTRPSHRDLTLPVLSGRGRLSQYREVLGHSKRCFKGSQYQNGQYPLRCYVRSVSIFTGCNCNVYSYVISHTDMFTGSINLSQLSSLSHLVIETNPGTPPEQGFDFLTKIISLRLHTLKISLLLIQGVARIDLLLSSSQFPALKNLSIFGTSWTDVRQFLPRCDAKNILHDVETT